MLAGDGPTGGWGQIGYIYKYNWGTYPSAFVTQYIQLNDGAHTPATHFWGSPTTGTTYTFKAGWDPTDQHLHLWLNGTDEAETNWNPFNVWSGSNSEWFEETKNLGDDVFGLTGSRTQFDNVMTKNASNTWVNQNWNGIGSSLCYYHVHEITSDSHFEAWTDPVDHNC